MIQEEEYGYRSYAHKDGNEGSEYTHTRCPVAAFGRPRLRMRAGEVCPIDRFGKERQNDDGKEYLQHGRSYA